MARINAMVSVAVSLFAYFALASQVQAQEAQTQPEGLVPHQVVRGERMRSPFHMGGTRRPGLLLEHGNISITEFIELHPDNGRGRGVGLRTCRIPRSERRMEVDGQRTTAPCPPSARVRIWYLLPGATVYLPPRDATAPAIAPPQPRPRRDHRPGTPRLIQPTAPVVVAQAQPVAPVTAPNPQPDPQIARLEERMRQQDEVLNSYRDEARRARTQQQQALAERDAARQANAQSAAAMRAMQTRLDAVTTELNNVRQRARTDLPAWERDPGEFALNALCGAAILACLMILWYLVSPAWKRWRKKRAVNNDADVMAIIPRKPASYPIVDEDGRITHYGTKEEQRTSLVPAEAEPDPRTSVPPDKLVDIVSRWDGYDPEHGMTYNLERLVGQASIAEQAGRQTLTTAAEAAARQTEAEELRAKLRNTEEQGKHLQKVNTELSELKRTLIERDQQVTRMANDASAVRSLITTVDATLKDESHGRIEFRNGSQSIEDLVGQLIPILAGVRTDRDLARRQLGETQEENAEAQAKERALQVILEDIRTAIVAANPSILPEEALKLFPSVMEELTFLRINAKLSASTPASQQTGPRALATDAPPPPTSQAPPASLTPSQSRLAALGETGEHALQAVTSSALHSANPPPPEGETTRQIDSGEQQGLIEASTAQSGDSLPPIPEEDTHPRGSLIDLAAAAQANAAQSGIGLELAPSAKAKPTGSRLPPKRRDTDRDFPSPVPPPPAVAHPGVILRRGPKQTAKGLGKPPPPPNQAVVGDRNAPRLPQTMCPPRPPGDGPDFAASEDGVVIDLRPPPSPNVPDPTAAGNGSGNGAGAPEIPDLTALAEDAGTGSLMAKGLRMSGIGMDSQAPPADASADADRPSIFEDEDGDADSSEPTVVGARPVIQPDDTGDSPPPKDQLH